MPDRELEVTCDFLHLIISHRGIGLESSILFAQEGASVLMTDINLEAAEKGAALIATKIPNAKVATLKTDVSKEEDIKAAVDKAVKEFGRLDVMVSEDLDGIRGF